MIVLPYDVCQSDASVGRCRTDAQIPDASSASTETNATFEKRGTTTDEAGDASRRGRGCARARAGRRGRRPRSRRRRRAAQSSASASARGASAPRGRRRRERAAPRRRRAARRRVRAARRPSVAAPLGPVEPQREPRPRRANSARHELEVEVAAPEGRDAHQRDERAERPERAQRELRGREQHVHRNGDEREPRATTRTRSRPRAGSSPRRARRAAARCRAQHEQPDRGHQREQRRPSVRRRATALPRSRTIDGITNCGAGPGFGPTANVNAPRTGWPSTEITRQHDEIPALRQSLHRYVELVRIRRRTRAAGRP